MEPVLVFFGVAALVGCVIRALVGLRLRSASQQPATSEAEMCQLDQASRISSVAVIASLAGLVLMGLAVLVL